MFANISIFCPKRLRFIKDSPNLKLVVIPSGRSMIGAPLAELEFFKIPPRYAQREYPPRYVNIGLPFAVSPYLVTRGEFRQFVEETGHEPAHWCEVFRDNDWRFDESLSWRDPGFPQGDDHPVVSISWFDAHVYLDWLSMRNNSQYRLLSDAEYEYATRAGTMTPWFWGNHSDQQSTYANGADLSSMDIEDTFSLSQTYGAPIQPAQCRTGYSFTSPVGKFKPNRFGLYDMSGNVWEWVEDCFSENHLPTTQSPAKWDNCDFRAIRGGSWAMEPAFLRSAVRQRDYSWHNDRDIGFRVARDLTPHEQDYLQ